MFDMINQFIATALKADFFAGGLALGDIPRRALGTIPVDDDRVKTLVADMRWFYSAQDWYAQRGVPWRRGYLFYGPPGTGKSSLIRALASELGLVNAATARRLFARFFPTDHGLALQFEDRLRGQMTNPAVIQGWLLVHSADPQMAATATGIITPSIAAAAE